jgi:DNA/RNA endonuclease YhcR with UshA esterase domain
MPENTAGKPKMRLGRRENTINDLKNEPASKTVINFHVMVTGTIFSLKNSGGVTIQMHFLQNESLPFPILSPF